MIHNTWGIVVACGKSEQISASADVGFLNLGKHPVLYNSLEVFERCSEIDSVMVLAARERLESIASMVRLFGCSKVRKLVAGASQRFATLAAGFKALDEEATLVCIHEVSRPCVQPDLVAETVKAAKRYGSGVAAVRMEEAFMETQKGQKASKVLTGGRYWQIQTPQAYKRDVLEKALKAAQKKKGIDDEASAVCAHAGEVHLVSSTTGNIKVRSLHELSLAAGLLKIQ